MRQAVSRRRRLFWQSFARAYLWSSIVFGGLALAVYLAVKLYGL